MFNDSNNTKKEDNRSCHVYIIRERKAYRIPALALGCNVLVCVSGIHESHSGPGRPFRPPSRYVSQRWQRRIQDHGGCHGLGNSRARDVEVSTNVSFYQNVLHIYTTGAHFACTITRLKSLMCCHSEVCISSNKLRRRFL